MLRIEKGSGLIKVIIYLAILAYIGLMIFRFASISIRYKDIEVKIRDTIRNSVECNPEKLKEQIYNLLDERGLIPREEEILVECKGNKAKIKFSYEETLDGLFFKKKILKEVSIESMIG
jgi:hypothetical protein